ncbi:MAG: zf-TFIIB domain-containing protein [Elusimicrobia bacterium]|nr:zf-TFIIB domain-containing protein [Elusimicrobiota bacterium]
MSEETRCPKCACLMEAKTHGGVAYDLCSGCRGLWFGEFQAEDMKKLKDAKKIDLGGLPGVALDKHRDYTCPKCQGVMVKMAVADQPHIRYEACARCYGTFFDAGEFKDFAVKDVLDGLKSLFAVTKNRLRDKK